MHNKSLARIVLCISLLISMLISGVAFAADEPSDPGGEVGGRITNYTSSQASVEVSFSCSFTRDSNSSDNYSTDLLNGSSAEIAGSTFTTFCNDSNGYSIYAIGYSNNEFGNTSLIFNNTPNSTNNIATNGTYSNWQMKATGITTNNLTPSIVNNFNSYRTIPDIYTRIATLGGATDTSNSSPSGSSISVSYQATASSSQPAGAYTGQVKYTMVHPATATPAVSIGDLTFMQDFAKLSATEKTSVLASMELNRQYQLKDKRDPINNGADYKTYYVSKLADGKVWMTQNLDHDIRTDTDFYTHANTDLGYGSTINTNAKWTAPSYVGTWSNGTADRTRPRYADPGDLCWDGTPEHTTPVDCAQVDIHYHLGNYYNWTAAIAMTSSSSYTSTANVNQSICPAGWTLPRGGAATATTNDFVNLLSQPEYGWSSSTNKLGQNKTMWGEPLYFALGGNWYGSLDGVGSSGRYWSSTVVSSSTAYFLGFLSGGIVNPATNYFRNYGFPIRCVVR